ncbi:MAG: T9SS type A sorting domain-containing protein, partial [Acidobacteriota bacterium]
DNINYWSSMRLFIKTLLALIILRTAPDLYSQVPSFTWAQSVLGRVEFLGIGVDSAGNSYFSGEINGAIRIGQQEFSTAGVSNCILAKLDVAGNFIWVKQEGGMTSFWPRDLAADASGNIYLTGGFTGSRLMLGSVSVTGNGENDAFLAKYNTNGECLWAVPIGGKSIDVGLGVTMDLKGNCYVTGTFQGTAAFGNGKALITQANATDMFVAKYDSYGACLWAVRGGSTNSSSGSFGRSISVDPAENVYVTGSFYGTMQFANSALDAGGGKDIFIAKIDSLGNPEWAKQSVSTTWALLNANGISTDREGNSTITGEIISSDPSFDQFQLPHSDAYRTFVARYDSKGSCLWATANSGNGFSIGKGLKVDAEGNTYCVGGYWSAQVTFGPWSSALEGQNAFILKYSPDGRCLWGKTTTNVGWDASGLMTAVALNGKKGLWTVGNFTTDCALDGIHLTGNGAFITRLDEVVLGVESQGDGLATLPTSYTLKQNYPNPFNPSTTIAFNLPTRSHVSLKIFDVIGREVAALASEELPAGNYTKQWNAAGMPSGVYFYQLRAGTHSETKKLLLQK